MISQKENARRLYHHEKTEFLPYMGQGIINNVPVNGYHERAGVARTGHDWFGVHWSWPEGEPAPMAGPGFILDDISEFEDVVKMPDLDAWDWEEAARIDRIPGFDFENNLLYQMIHNGIFERMHALMGMEEALCATAIDPEGVRAYAEKMVDYKCALIDKLAVYYHPDVICYHDDWGTQRGLFFSPETWRDLFKEPTRRICEHTKNLGIAFELHSDGDIHTLVPEIVDDIKVDGLNIQKINNIPELKKTTGEKVVYNVFLDTVSLDVRDSASPLSEADIRKSIHDEVIAQAEGGCYIGAKILVRPEWDQIIDDEYERCRLELL